MTDLHRSIDYVPASGGKLLEPALFLARGRTAVAIPLSMAHEFTEDSTAIEKAMQYAGVLYGDGGFTRFDVYRIVDAISWGLVDLVSAPPAPLPGQQQIEHAMARHGLVIRSGGKTLVDAR